MGLSRLLLVVEKGMGSRMALGMRVVSWTRRGHRTASAEIKIKIILIQTRLVCLLDRLCDTAVVAHLNTQRNAIKMLHDRMVVLLDYIGAVIKGGSSLSSSLLPLSLQLHS
jgi:hypothetical protein